MTANLAGPKHEPAFISPLPNRDRFPSMDLDQLLWQPLSTASTTLNANPGILALSIFILTILFGWVSGIFKALRRKPDLKICTIPGPSFVCVFGTGKKHREYDTHSTGIALYLRITNLGASPTTITGVRVGYRQNMWARNILDFVRYRVNWLYIDEQTIALSDFQVSIGESLKFYPFLIQKSVVSGESPKTYLAPGRSTNGVVYFEQPESWGGYFPRSRNFKTKVKIVLSDSFKKRYRYITRSCPEPWCKSLAAIAVTGG